MPASLFLEITASEIATTTSTIASPSPGTVAAGTNAIKIDTGKKTTPNQNNSLYVGTNFTEQPLIRFVWRLSLKISPI
jgi:hypothetical protein